METDITLGRRNEQYFCIAKVLSGRSHMGQTRPFGALTMSELPGIADIERTSENGREVPIAEVALVRGAARQIPLCGGSGGLWSNH
jgi:hypothetical protein